MFRFPVIQSTKFVKELGAESITVVAFVLLMVETIRPFCSVFLGAQLPNLN